VLSEDRDILRALHRRIHENVEQKRAIALAARELLREDDTVYLDAGSTCALLARELRDMSLRVVTNSLNVMAELSSSPQITLYSLGGSFRSDAGSFIGPVALEALRNFQIETCFMGTTGLTGEGVCSSQNLIEAQLKRTVLESSRRRVILADHTKLGTTAFAVFAQPGDYDILVTDAGPAETERLRALGIEVILAPRSAAA
jgi:DeoR/GlpR family transcriptional regulator of sugar metabolism